MAKYNEAIRKITKTGNYTYYINIPREYIKVLGWRKKQKVVVKLSEKKIIIDDWVK